MFISENPALPESLAVVVEAAISDIANASPDDVPAILDPMREEWIDAVQDGIKVDPAAVYAAFPPLPADIADAAEAALDEAHDAAISAMPISLTFADANPIRVLSGLRVLAFEDGKHGKDYYVWHHDAAMALCAAMRLPEGPIPPRYDQIMAALESAFEDGRKAGGIEDDPPPVRTVHYMDRVESARDTAARYLTDATDLDDLADEIAVEFKIQSGDAWLVVEAVSRAAAVAGDFHASGLRLKQVIGVRAWFIDHANKLEARGVLTVRDMVLRDRARKFMAELAA
ncbi:MAG: hypothetical protein WCY92_11325 [Novosphingobium sp.]